MDEDASTSPEPTRADPTTEVSDSQLASLETSNRMLSQDVRGLTDTLRVVGELQERQREQSLKQAQTDRVVAAQQRAVDQRALRGRRLLAGLVVGFALLLGLASFISYAITLNHVNDLLSRVKDVQYQTCLARNRSAIAGSVREKTLADAETNPRLAEVHRTSSEQLRTSVVSCDEVSAE